MRIPVRTHRRAGKFSMSYLKTCSAGQTWEETGAVVKYSSQSDYSLAFSFQSVPLGFENEVYVSRLPFDTTRYPLPDAADNGSTAYLFGATTWVSFFPTNWLNWNRIGVMSLNSAEWFFVFPTIFGGASAVDRHTSFVIYEEYH